ncbi:MAG: DUF3572 family protein [Hyphomicrobium sp.]
MTRLTLRDLTDDGAAALALQGLAFLAADAERLSRFLALTGCGPADLRAQAQTPEFQASVLEHLLADESLLLLFASEAGVRPEALAQAHAILVGPT